MPVEKHAGDRVIAMDKELTAYDALGTGLFVCPPGVWDAAVQVEHADVKTLTRSLKPLAAHQLIRAVDIGSAAWCDIDAVEDPRVAHQLLG